MFSVSRCKDLSGHKHVLFDAFGRPHPGSTPGLKNIKDFNGRKEMRAFLWILCRPSIYLDLWE